jgi:hypothetical protein
LLLGIWLIFNLLEIGITKELDAQRVFLQILQEIVCARVNSVVMSKVEFGVAVLPWDWFWGEFLFT